MTCNLMPISNHLVSRAPQTQP